MVLPSYRRSFGLLLGALIGLTIGLVTQGINHILMPGVPLYQPPFGAWINGLLCFALACVLGILTSWSNTSAIGVFLSSLFGALVISASTMASGQTDAAAQSQKAFALILISGSVIASLVPVLVIFRWIVNREETARTETLAGFKIPVLRRWALPVLLVIIAGSLSLTAMQNKMARAVLVNMHDLIQSGLQAQTQDALPEPLRSQAVSRFLEQGQGTYLLEWDKDDLNRYYVSRPSTDLTRQSTVIAHYSNGYLLVCKFPDETGQPRCKDFPTGG